MQAAALRESGAACSSVEGRSSVMFQVSRAGVGQWRRPHVGANYQQGFIATYAQGSGDEALLLIQAAARDIEISKHVTARPYCEDEEHAERR